MRLFGTDGIRGPANEPPLTPPTLEAIARVLARILARNGGERHRVVLGNDGRRSAAMIQCSLAAGLLSEGCEVLLGGLMTTPCLAHLTREGGFDSGIMISASHNRAGDNGIKIFGPDGSKIPDPVERDIEEGLAGDPEPAHGTLPGMLEPSEDPCAPYVDFLRRKALPDLQLGGMRILVDCANGGASFLASRVLRSFGAEVEVRHDRPDGDNINEGCGALHPEALASTMEKGNFDFGLCLDGDGDRAIFIDERGRVVHGDALLTLLALDLRKRSPEDSGIAVTVMSNLGLKKVCAEAGIEVVETPVGDRSVVSAMRNRGLLLGGENSGHVIFGPEHHFAGDGLYTGLKVAELCLRRERPLSELASVFTPFPQLLLNVPVSSKPPLQDIPEIASAVAEVERELAEEGRVVLRYSGTEKLCRVMVEGPTEEAVRESAERIADAVRSVLGT